MGNSDNEMKPSPDPSVDVGVIVGCEDGDTRIFPSSSQEVIEVCITIVTLFHVSAFAKKRVRFVKKQNDATAFCRAENTAEILFCLANVFRDYGIQIDPVQAFSEVARQSLSGDKALHPIFAR